jgi:hypothetical protein
MTTATIEKNGKTRDQAMRERLEQIPKRYRPAYRAAMRGRSRKAAIKAQCLECCGWERTEVQACTDTGCPLHPYRPYVAQGFSPTPQ